MAAQESDREISQDVVSVGDESSEALSEPLDPTEILFQQVMERLEKAGDLPIFSASVNQIHMVGNDPDSDAMELALEVLKDANLTAKVLRLANSPYYSRGSVKIGALSRAIIMLGFDAIKSTVLAMKMIDSFQHKQPGIDMSSMLVNSYMTAGLVKEMASECGIKNIEASYVCGLLHNIGEVIFAYTMPEMFIEMKTLMEEEDVSWTEAQKKVIGMPLRKVGQQIVERWDFPKTVSKTMAPHISSKRKGPMRDPVELNRSLSSLSTRMMDLLFSDVPTTTQSFSDITKELSSITGINQDVVGKCLDKSFKKSCDLAEEYGLDKELLLPKMRDSNDEDRNAVAGMLTRYVGVPDELEDDDIDAIDCDDGYDTDAQEVLDSDELDDQESYVDPGGDANVLLNVLHELATMMSEKAHLNSVFKKVLDGMHKGVGFDRAMLCLLSPDHMSYSGRLVVGYRAEKMKKFFYQFPVNVHNDLLSKMIMEDDLLLVSDVYAGNYLQKMPNRFEEIVATNTFIIAALRIKNRPIGVFYADKSRQGTAITKAEQRGFLQLVAQAKLALQVH